MKLFSKRIPPLRCSWIVGKFCFKPCRSCICIILHVMVLKNCSMLLAVKNKCNLSWICVQHYMIRRLMHNLVNKTIHWFFADTDTNTNYNFFVILQFCRCSLLDELSPNVTTKLLHMYFFSLDNSDLFLLLIFFSC